MVAFLKRTLQQRTDTIHVSGNKRRELIQRSKDTLRVPVGAKNLNVFIFQELTDRLEGMKVAHQDEKQDYERQILLELFTENGAVFKTAQNTFNIKWCRLPVAPWLLFLVDILDTY